MRRVYRSVWYHFFVCFPVLDEAEVLMMIMEELLGSSRLFVGGRLAARQERIPLH